MKRNRLIIDNKKIEREIKEYYRKIRNTKSDLVKATNYRLIATALEQLENPSAEIKQEIENCYKEAIRLNPNKKASYLADLSNFYLSINNIEGAIQNISTIEETKQELIGIERDYVNDTITNLKTKQKQLEKDNITTVAADPQLDYIKIIKNLVHRLNEYDQLFEVLSSRLSCVEDQLEVYKKAHRQDTDDSVADTDRENNDLLDHSELVSRSNINEVASFSEDMSNDLVHEVVISGEQ